MDECVNNPCQNGASCVNSDGGYSCQCAAGWTGDECNQGVFFCSSVKLMSGSTILINKSTETIFGGLASDERRMPKLNVPLSLKLNLKN